MPEVRILVSYPGSPYHSGQVVEIDGEEARSLVRSGQAEFTRTVETTSVNPTTNEVRRVTRRAVPQDAIESTTPSETR